MLNEDRKLADGSLSRLRDNVDKRDRALASAEMRAAALNAALTSTGSLPKGARLLLVTEDDEGLDLPQLHMEAPSGAPVAARARGAAARRKSTKGTSPVGMRASGGAAIESSDESDGDDAESDAGAQSPCPKRKPKRRARGAAASEKGASVREESEEESDGDDGGDGGDGGDAGDGRKRSPARTRKHARRARGSAAASGRSAPSKEEDASESVGASAHSVEGSSSMVEGDAWAIKQMAATLGPLLEAQSATSAAGTDGSVGVGVAADNTALKHVGDGESLLVEHRATARARMRWVRALSKVLLLQAAERRVGASLKFALTVYAAQRAVANSDAALQAQAAEAERANQRARVAADSRELAAQRSELLTGELTAAHQKLQEEYTALQARAGEQTARLTELQGRMQAAAAFEQDHVERAERISIDRVARLEASLAKLRWQLEQSEAGRTRQAAELKQALATQHRLGAAYASMEASHSEARSEQERALQRLAQVESDFLAERRISNERLSMLVDERRKARVGVEGRTGRVGGHVSDADGGGGADRTPHDAGEVAHATQPEHAHKMAHAKEQSTPLPALPGAQPPPPVYVARGLAASRSQPLPVVHRTSAAGGATRGAPMRVSCGFGGDAGMGSASTSRLVTAKYTKTGLQPVYSGVPASGTLSKTGGGAWKPPPSEGVKPPMKPRVLL